MKGVWGVRLSPSPIYYIVVVSLKESSVRCESDFRPLWKLRETVRRGCDL
jgi:hypothetical protein